jgi:hypothetical protein
MTDETKKKNQKQTIVADNIGALPVWAWNG